MLERQKKPENLKKPTAREMVQNVLDTMKNGNNLSLPKRIEGGRGIIRWNLSGR